MKTKLLFGAVALFVTMAVASCKKEPGEPTVVFPERETVSVVVEGRDVLEFKASHDWELTVLDNAGWFRFVKNNEDTVGVTDTTGVAGNVSMKYYVVNAGLNAFINTPATLQLTMKGTNKVIFDITCAPLTTGDAAMFIKPITGDPRWVEELAFVFESGRSGPFNVGFNAKFDWEVESVPNGVNVEVKTQDNDKDGVYEVIPFQDEANSLVQFRYFSIAPEKIGYPLPAGSKIVIGDRNSAKTIEFPISYAGMGEEDILISPNVLTRAEGIGFTFNGFLIDPASGDPSTRTVQTGTVYVKDMDYSLFVVKYDATAETSTDITTGGWVTATKGADGAFEFSAADNSGEAREAYLLVLPKKYADDPKLNDFAQIGTYIEKGYAIKVTQETGIIVTGQGFFVGWGETPAQVTAGYGQEFSMLGNTAPTSGQFPTNTSMTWEYTFSSADIDGKLAIAPLGFPAGQTWGFVKLESHQVGNWNDVTLENGVEISNSTNGVLLNVTTTTNLRAGRLLFFKEDYRIFDNDFPNGFDNLSTKADAAIVLIQNP